MRYKLEHIQSGESAQVETLDAVAEWLDARCECLPQDSTKSVKVAQIRRGG